MCSEKHYSRITQHFGSPRCRNPQGEEPTLGSSAASPALKFLSGAPATPAGCLQRTPSTAWSSDGVTPSSVQAPVKTFLFLSPNQQFFLLSSGIQYCTHKWLCWRAAYRYLWKKIIEKSADEPHAVELLLHRLLNLRLVGFPPGHDAWGLNAGENPHENPKVCVCPSPTCRAWKPFRVERVIYMRSSRRSSPLIVPYVYAKPLWWGARDYISVNYNVLSDPLAGQRRSGEAWIAVEALPGISKRSTKLAAASFGVRLMDRLRAAPWLGTAAASPAAVLLGALGRDWPSAVWDENRGVNVCGFTMRRAPGCRTQRRTEVDRDGGSVI